jgi:hypothetical protein
MNQMHSISQIQYKMDDKYELLVDNEDLLAEVKNIAVKRREVMLHEVAIEKNKLEKEFVECMKNKQNWFYDIGNDEYRLEGFKGRSAIDVELSKGDLQRLLGDYIKKEILVFGKWLCDESNIEKGFYFVVKVYEKREQKEQGTCLLQ